MGDIKVYKEGTNYERLVEPNMTKIVHMVRLGISERRISEEIGVGYTAWCSYKSTHPEFKQTILEARRQTSHSVERALYKRATGYEYTEIKTVQVAEDPSKETMTITTKHIPPDVVACIFWLTNRDKEHWRQRNEVDHTVQAPQTLAEVIRNRRQIADQNGNGHAEEN